MRRALITIAAVFFLHGTSFGFNAPYTTACEWIVQASDADLHPELSKSQRKKLLIAGREVLVRNDPSNKKITDLTGFAGDFRRTYDLKSGEKIFVQGLAKATGQVLKIESLSVYSVKTKKFWFWQTEYISFHDKAVSSPSEMRRILKALEQEARDYGITLLVLEGDRATGARHGPDDAYIQVTVDMNKKG